MLTKINSEMVKYLPSGVGAVATTVQEELRRQQATTVVFKAAPFYGVGDGVADDYPKFLAALAAAVAQNLPLDISDCKIYLASQSAPINLDGVWIIGNGKPLRPPLDIPYLNGADNAVANWTLIKAFQGSAIFSRYNGAIFTGKVFGIKNAAVVCDYTKANASAFVQSTPTAYPGWSQALVGTDVDVYYTGSHGIELVGGLEICNIRNVNVYASGKNPLKIGMTAGINCPIEYLDFDTTCSFIYGALNNVLLDGFRRHVKFDGCLVNASGQYDAKLVANPSFTVPYQTSILSPISVVALAPGVYGGVNHSGSDQLTVTHCYAEVSQGMVVISGAPINNVCIERNHLIPWNSDLPSNMLALYGKVYRLRTSGNTDLSGAFKVYIAPAVVAYANDYVFGESSTAGALSFVGSTPHDTALIPVAYNQQSGSIGDGTAGTFTYSLAINGQAPNNTAATTAIWAITANFQSSVIDRNETVLMAVTRMNSGNYTGQVLIPPATANSFSSAPSVSTDGILSIPLTLYTRARVTRLDTQPLRIW